MAKRKNPPRKLLNLFCLVDGEATSNAFSIKVPSTDTVDDLKNLIKTKKANDFSNIDADKLTLWGVLFLFSPSKRKEFIFLKDLPTARELYPMDTISDVFKDPLIEKSVNIIVQRPPPETAKKMRGPLPRGGVLTRTR
ncbi:hypothetical protein BG000_006920 [Podila horticola]|nr:hypothetical protein BG000_006920 [Podila horticola]